jgi:hypothetical protein
MNSIGLRPSRVRQWKDWGNTGKLWIEMLAKSSFIFSYVIHISHIHIFAFRNSFFSKTWWCTSNSISTNARVNELGHACIPDANNQSCIVNTQVVHFLVNTFPVPVHSHYVSIEAEHAGSLQFLSLFELNRLFEQNPFDKPYWMLSCTAANIQTHQQQVMSWIAQEQLKLK